MGEISGISRCPKCGKWVTPHPERHQNDPIAFRCLFCELIVCDWCYSMHTKEVHADPEKRKTQKWATED
jgi:ssDNA-binding Zn-finger/Zn-ribbon topoisomerase 1